MDLAIELAQRAGDIVLGIRERGLNPETIRTKLGHFDIVTEADLASERFILSELRSAYPTYGIIAEETSQGFSDAEWVWIVDPLDGTTNYSHGLPIYGVNISLAHNGYPVLGVTYEPANNRTYWAMRGRGAWVRTGVQNGNGESRLHVSEVNELKHAILATGFQYCAHRSGPCPARRVRDPRRPDPIGPPAGRGIDDHGVGGRGAPRGVLGEWVEAVGFCAGLGDDRRGRGAPD